MSLLSLSNTFDPTLYSLNLDIDHQKSNFNGQLTISLQRNKNNGDGDVSSFKFSLNSSELVVLSAIFIDDSQIEHKAKISYDRSNELVNLSTEQDLNSNAALSLNLKFLGKINTIKTYRDFTKGIFKTNYLDDRNNNSTNYIIATHSQASFARFIYPCIDEPNSKAQFQLTIKTSETFTVLSNSLPTSREIKDQKQIVEFSKTPLMNSSIFGFIIGDLELIESQVQLSQGSKSIPLRFFTPIGEISKAVYPHDIASKILPFISKLFPKTSYPLEKLDFISLPFLSDGAMENFGLITIQSSHILVDSLKDKEQLKNIRQLIAHEIIHHWVGNNVSFDEWSHLWLNESFATWFAYYVLAQLKIDDDDQRIWEQLTNIDLESIFESDSHIGSKSIVTNLDNPNVKSTQDAFQVHSYNKGIQFLRMFANVVENKEFNDNLPRFVESLDKFIHEWEFKTIKPMNIWKWFHDDSNLDLLGFTHSWLRTPGFPIVSVSINEEGLIQLEQHRFLETPIDNEDVPYHIPLAIKLKDGSIINKIMNDRSMILKEINIDEFVKLNTNRIGIYRAHYKSQKFIDNLIKNYELLSLQDLFGIFHDFNIIIGNEHHQTDDDIIGFLKISEKVINNDVLQFPILQHVLNNLEVLENSYKIHSSIDQYKSFSNWLQELNLKLFGKLEWKEVNYSKLSKPELETRKHILSIGLSIPKINKIHEFFFKKIQHGPRQSVPEEFLVPIFQSISLTANQTTWKKILSLVKSPGATTNHVIQGSDIDIQNAAIRSLGFTKDVSLVKRVLNFVQTNIDSNMVELALVGLLYNRESNKTSLWDWFKLNYEHWVMRSLRPGSKYSAELGKTTKNITIIVLSVFISDNDKEKRDEWVKEQIKKLPEHGLKENVSIVEDSQKEKLIISKSIGAVVSYLK
ncbi:Aminopeptidase N [Wickerhamomyces ciferrii]|uniref:Aminopeptidase n=1 Tax=Wickerhamomyces ciferrii (strain ATCC 14091 / BCRC 22168 / CBS 111 / JCM 3599 / NBRC 0793 / NRRL Y-1031 F-60-10) TaxID=1206466 RepID=K0KM87_WICCF|nr:Aminopeptidase N [Wickerhamomyces ciferrii]CCH42494.1 Aminopeptidase N [Wickerhamomyces ciferrii]